MDNPKDNLDHAREGIAHLSETDGLRPVIRPDFYREQWATCHIAQLAVGAVFALPDAPRVPVVLTLAHTSPAAPNETHGLMTGVARPIEGGPARPFRLSVNTPVLTRCDLHYVPTGDLSFAIMRAGQIERRIREHHPRVAQDPHLAALIRSLRDELEDQRIIAEDAEDKGGE